MTHSLKTIFNWRNNQISRIFDTIENSVLSGINFHIAGGSALKLYLRQDLDLSDIDLWFGSMGDLQAAIEQWKNGLANSEQLMLVAQTDNGFTFYCSDSRFERCFKVQMITKSFNDSIERTIRDFDFTVCQVAYRHGRIYLTPEAYRDINDKVLRLARTYNRVLCHTRMRKYMMLGFNPTIELYDRAFIHGRDYFQYGSVTVNNSEYYNDQ